MRSVLSFLFVLKIYTPAKANAQAVSGVFEIKGANKKLFLYLLLVAIESILGVTVWADAPVKSEKKSIVTKQKPIIRLKNTAHAIWQ